MNKASQIIILCEDKLQDVVVHRFLTKGWGVKPRIIRRVPYPSGSGSGEAHVRKRYPDELKAFRSRPASTVLIAVIDADTKSVSQHHRELDTACSNIPSRQEGEAIVHIIPKHHIETWLAYLDGVEVDEAQNYKQSHGFKGRESECHRLVDELAGRCKNNVPLSGFPPSLVGACKEFKARLSNSL